MNKTFLYNQLGAESTIVSLYLGKTLVKDIATRYSVTPRTIHNIIKKHGVTRGSSKRTDLL